jgi:uncharacterized integral membrane protein
MNFLLKKLIFSLVFNSSLFFILLLGIQNSSQKARINLLVDKTVELPISFTVGISFITGSLVGNLLLFKYNRK